MKNTIKALLAVAALSTATFASAIGIPSTGSVKITNTPYDGGPNPGLQGGEFGAIVSGYPTFYTFCVEYSEYMPVGSTFDYSLSMVADSTGDAISMGTAFLYKAFVQGKLYARLMDGDNGTHDKNAGYLQKAIWYLEDNVGPNYSNIASNPFVNLVIAEYGSLAAAKADATADMGVRVMNLFINGETYQDVLVYVPDSGATLALLGLALSAVAIARRRRAA